MRGENVKVSFETCVVYLKERGEWFVGMCVIGIGASEKIGCRRVKSHESEIGSPSHGRRLDVPITVYWIFYNKKRVSKKVGYQNVLTTEHTS